MKKLTKRSKKGFTLVELIVVIAILAILAGVAIPVYSGYITKAKEASDITKLDPIKTAVVFVKTEAATKAGTAVPTITSIEVKTNAIKANGTDLTADELKAVATLCGMGETFAFTFESAPNDTATWSSTGNSWSLSKATT